MKTRLSKKILLPLKLLGYVFDPEGVHRHASIDTFHDPVEDFDFGFEDPPYKVIAVYIDHQWVPNEGIYDRDWQLVSEILKSHGERVHHE